MTLLDQSLQTWLVDYNQHRPNHGDYMAGRTPLQVKKELRCHIRQTAACSLTTQSASQRRRPVTPTREPQDLGRYLPPSS